jgi:hypothetical protein
MLIKFGFTGAVRFCRVFSMVQHGRRVPAKYKNMIPERGNIWPENGPKT